jgi:hypothetical protein
VRSRRRTISLCTSSRSSTGGLLLREGNLTTVPPALS